MTTASFGDFARKNGWHPSYVTRLKQSGRLVLTEDGKVDVEASEIRIKATEDPNRDDVRARHARARKEKNSSDGSIIPPPDPQASQISESYTKSRAVKERYLALTAKLDYDRAAGLVVDTATVKNAGAAAGSALRAALENLPDQLAPLLAPVTDEDEVRRLLDDHMEIVLTQLADKFSAAMHEKNE